MPQSKRLYLHVGPHKTGSTFLQKRLTAARAVLREHGIEYPEVGFAIAGHHRIVDVFRRPAATELNVSALRDALSRFDQLIISSENFVFLDDQQLTSFRELFADHEIVVVFYIRSIADIWPSHWQETVKHGNAGTFLEYMGTVEGWLDSFDLTLIDQNHQLEKLAAVFVLQNVVAISYDNVLASGSNIFDHFWEHVLQLPPHNLSADNSSVNPSFPPERIELIRTLNQLFRERQRRLPGAHLRKLYQRKRKPLEAAPAFEAFADEFRNHAITMKISKSHPRVRKIDETLMANFGGRIINRHSDKELMASYADERSVLCAHRNWVFRTPSADFVEGLYRKLHDDVTDQLRAAHAPIRRKKPQTM